MAEDERDGCGLNGKLRDWSHLLRRQPLEPVQHRPKPRMVSGATGSFTVHVGYCFRRPKKETKNV